MNRTTQKSPDGMAVVTFAYDLAGRLSSASTPTITGNPASGQWDYLYDTAGRLTSEESPDSKTVSYELDDNGNVIKITYPDSYYVERVFDELNRLTDIKLNGSSTPAVQFSYDELSRRTQLTFGNGVQTDYGYEWNDDMSSLDHTFSGSSLDFAYGFNDAHQLISQTISDNQHSWHPTANSLIEYKSNELNQYEYASGSCGRLYKGYNDNGCLIDDGVWKFGFDTENHLISADDGSTSVGYVYDPMHRQIQKNVDGTKTRYVYSGWQLLADYDGTSDTLQNRYVFGVGLDEPLIVVAAGGTLSYLHVDRLGSVMALTNGTGAVTNRYAYSPWGESDSISGTTFGYTGQRFDEETGLYFYKNRYYSPVLGMFLQPDPIGYSRGDLNLYNYVLNDPFNLTDPLGLHAVGKYYSDTLRPVNYLFYENPGVFGETPLVNDLFVVQTHGHSNGTVSNIDPPIGPDTVMSVDDLIKKLIEIKKDKKPILLAVCYSAKENPDRDDKKSIAERVAEKLHVPTIGRMGQVKPTLNGVTGKVSYYSGNGSWQVFDAKGRYVGKFNNLDDAIDKALECPS